MSVLTVNLQSQNILEYVNGKISVGIGNWVPVLESCLVPCDNEISNFEKSLIENENVKYCKIIIFHVVQISCKHKFLENHVGIFNYYFHEYKPSQNVCSSLADLLVKEKCKS